jgi:GNAT superfamily N-acetyltransferase
MIIEVIDSNTLQNMFNLPINENYEINLKYCLPRFMHDQINIVAYDGQTKQIAGIRGFGLNKSTNHIKHYMNFYVTVHPDFRGQGVAKNLSIFLLNHLQNLGEPVLLTNSSYTEEGLVLKEMWEDLIQGYPNIRLLHKITGGTDLQDARYPMLEIDEAVYITAEDGSLQKGKVIDCYPSEVYEPMVSVRLDSNSTCVRVSRIKVSKV